MEDIVTERHAQIIARDYNIAPVENLKCERVIGDHTTDSLWFATGDRSIRCFVQYDNQDLPKP